MTEMIFAEIDMPTGIPKRRVCRSICAAMAVAGLLSTTAIASSAAAPEDRYIATRDAAIAKLSPLYDAGALDDAATKAEAAAFVDLRSEERRVGKEC